MTYSNYINLLYADNSREVIDAYNSNLTLLDKYISNIYTYNIESDSDITIPIDSIFIILTDTNNILTGNRALTLTTTYTSKILFIRNNTPYTIEYSGNFIQPNTLKCIFNSENISLSSKVELDLYQYILGKPDINNVLYTYKRGKPYYLLSGYAISSVSATSNTYFDVYLDNIIIGSIAFTAGNTEAALNILSSVYYSSTNKLRIKSRGVQDSTLENICFKFTILED